MADDVAAQVADVIRMMNEMEGVKQPAAMLPQAPKPTLFGFLADRKNAIDNWVKNMMEPEFIKGAKATGRGVGNQMKFFQAIQGTPDMTMKDYAQHLDILRNPDGN